MNVFHDLIYYWQMRHCPHPSHRIWCIHGDRINQRNGARGVCMDCNRTFKKLPARCSTASIREGFSVYHTPDSRMQDSYDDELGEP